MRMMVCAVRDVKADAFHNLFLFPTQQMAERAFCEVVQSGGGNMIAKYPHDHSIYQLAFYDDSNGRIESLPVPILIATGSQFVKLEAAVAAE